MDFLNLLTNSSLSSLPKLWGLPFINETLLVVHAMILVGVVIMALRLGKEALVTTFCILAVLANLFPLKQVEFFHLTITCSDAYEIGSFLALAFINRHFGENLAKKAIWICFFILMLFALSGVTHLFYKPSECDTMHASYAKILGHTPRIFLASIFSYFCSQKLSLLLQNSFSKAKKIPTAITISSAIGISQLFDNFMFTYLAFFGVLNHLLHVIFMSYVIKVLSLFVMTPFIKFSDKIITKPVKSPL